MSHRGSRGCPMVTMTPEDSYIAIFARTHNATAR